VSLVNTVLCTICAEQFRIAASLIKGSSMAPVEVTRKMLNDHWRVVFNGDGYDPTWPAAADALGLCHIDSGVDALRALTIPKNVALLSSQVQVQYVVVLVWHLPIVE
jgi:glutamine synthetase